MVMGAAEGACPRQVSRGRSTGPTKSPASVPARGSLLDAFEPGRAYARLYNSRLASDLCHWRNDGDVTGDKCESDGTALRSKHTATARTFPGHRADGEPSRFPDRRAVHCRAGCGCGRLRIASVTRARAVPRAGSASGGVGCLEAGRHCGSRRATCSQWRQD